MRKFRTLISASLLFVFSVSVYAQDESAVQIEVPQIFFDKITWGEQQFSVKLTNRSEFIKFITLVSNVKCNGTFQSPARKITKNVVLYSGSTVETDWRFLVPGNYGEIQLELKAYDVIDTMDYLMEMQVIYKNSGSFSVPAPEEIAGFIKHRITLPPLVGKHIDFDNDFSRVLPFLLSQGNTIFQIAKKTGAPLKFINEEIDYLASRGYYKIENGNIVLGVTPITEAEADEEKKLAIETAGKVSTQLGKNIKTYRSIIDSLVNAGQLSKDSNSFMDGGTVLYRPYPVVMALSLWFDIGGDFITGDEILTLYNGSDFCNAYIPNFTYLVAGDRSNNGYQYFAFIQNNESFQIHYGDTIPRIHCPENFMFDEDFGKSIMWEYEQPYFPETFMIDTNIVRPVLDHLNKGMKPILDETLSKLTANARNHGHSSLTQGHKFWFWNIVASRVTELMVVRGVIEKHGNGQYRFDGMNFK